VSDLLPATDGLYLGTLGPPARRWNAAKLLFETINPKTTGAYSLGSVNFGWLRGIFEAVAGSSKKGQIWMGFDTTYYPFISLQYQEPVGTSKTGYRLRNMAGQFYFEALVGGTSQRTIFWNNWSDDIPEDRVTQFNTALNPMEHAMYDLGGVLGAGQWIGPRWRDAALAGFFLMGDITSRGLEALPDVSDPVEGEKYRGSMIMVKGDGVGTADTVYVCLMSATGSYSWLPMVSG